MLPASPAPGSMPELYVSACRRNVPGFIWTSEAYEGTLMRWPDTRKLKTKRNRAGDRISAIQHACASPWASSTRRRTTISHTPDAHSLAQLICVHCSGHIERSVCSVKQQPVFICPHCGKAIDAGRLARILTAVEEELAHARRQRSSAKTPRAIQEQQDCCSSADASENYSDDSGYSDGSGYVTRGWVTDPTP